MSRLFIGILGITAILSGAIGVFTDGMPAGLYGIVLAIIAHACVLDLKGK